MLLSILPDMSNKVTCCRFSASKVTKSVVGFGKTLIFDELSSEMPVGSSGVTQKVTMAVLQPQGMVIMMSSQVTVPGSISGRRVA